MSRARAAIALGLALLPAGEATAQEPVRLAAPDVPSKVATYAGVTAYSERDPATGFYRLMYDTNSNGRADAVPVPQRAVPFDVDLGPGEDGRVLAVYSRCRQEPAMDRRSGGPLPVWTTARRCDLYRYDFRTQQESPLVGPSTGSGTEILPSIWRDEVAFVRVYHRREGRRGELPYVYVKALRPDSSSRRQPGGARGSSGIPGPTALDLSDGVLGLTWTYERPGGGVSEARAVEVDGDHRKFAGRGWNDSVLLYLTPHVADGHVHVGEQRSQRRDAQAGPGTRSLASRLWRHRMATGETSSADAPAQLFAAAHDRRTGVTVHGTTQAFLTATGCGPAPCSLTRAGGRPAWELVRIAGAARRACGDVAFTPNSEDGAFDVTAHGTSCDVALAVARGSRAAAGRPYAAEGFSCVGVAAGSALPSTRYTCRAGSGDATRAVTFIRG